MSIVIIHEGGVVASSLEGSRKWTQLGLQPVFCSGPAGEYLCGRLNRSLDIEVSQIIQDAPKTIPPLFKKALALSYSLGATVHHCSQLARLYRSICQRFTSSYAVFDSDDCAEFVSYGYQPEPYYELDALVLSARLSYNRIGYYIWQEFEQCGGMPDNVGDILKGMHKCPPEILQLLTESWINTGVKLKDYRDFTQHQAPLYQGLSTIQMERFEHETWKVRAPIPNNPEEKSHRRLCFAGKLDALSYGWRVTQEVVDVATSTLQACNAAR